MGDLSFMEQGGQDAYDALYQGYESAPEADRVVGNEPIRSFTHYVVEFGIGKGSLSKEKGTPQIRGAARVVEGPAGTVGENFFWNRYLSVNPFKTEKDGSQRELSKDEYTKKIADFQEVQKRIEKRLGFGLGMPRRPVTNETNLDEYGKQFEGKRVVVEVRLEKAKGEYDARNSIQWQSIAGLEDVVSDKQTGARLGTALEMARKEIEKADKKGAGAKGGRASTFGGGAGKNDFGA